MSLIRWGWKNQVEPINELQRELNQLFDASLGSLFRKAQLSGETVWSPAVDVYDNKDSFIIKADLPGMTQKDINVSLQDGILTITGQKKHETEVKEDNYYRLERAYGTFQRQLSLPTNVDATNIKATYKDGVLQLSLPKKEESKPKQISVDIN